MDRDGKPLFGSDSLAKLLQMGAAEGEGSPDAEPSDPDEQKAETLGRLLRSALPLNEVLAQALPMAIQRVCQELDALSTGAMENALLDSATDLGVIEQIKAHAKKVTKTSDSAVEKEAATVLYYTAIASAVVFHNERITTMGYAKLHRSFADLSTKVWVSREIAGLLEDAAKVCAKQAGGKRQESRPHGDQ